MQNNSSDNNFNKFPYRFSGLMLLLFIVGLLLAAAGFAVNTWQFIIFLQGDISSPYDWLKFALLYLASTLMMVLIVSMLVKSEYRMTEKELILQFGIVKSRYGIDKIYAVGLAGAPNKLALYFDDFKTKFIVIALKECYHADFIRALSDRNGKIEIDLTPPQSQPKE